MLSVYPMKNYLKTCEHPFFIRSYCSDTIELDELIDIMAKGRTTLSKPDITGCLQLFVEELINLVSDGKHVKTPVGAFYLSASGKLDTVAQPFSPGSGTLDHALTLHFRTNKAIEGTMKTRARWERVESFDTTAASVEAITVIGRAEGEASHAGDTVRITGRRLKFDPAVTDCGVFLETETESVRIAVYPDIAPSKLIAILPADLPAGTYDVVVATMPNGKDRKEGYYEKPLIVE
ncbi:MAG: DNA-binding domain-containing protein [Treponemataceae bacterium]